MDFTFNHWIIGLSMALAILFGGCDKSPPAPQPTAQAPLRAVPTASQGPRFTLAEPLINFGQINDFDSRTVPVSFTNTGNAVLVVERVQPTCGCTTTKLDKKTYAPGESGAIDLQFSPKGSGPQTKYVKIHTNDSSQPITNLTIKSDVRQTVTAKPRIFSLKDIPLGRPFATSSILESANPTYSPTSVSISGDLSSFATASLTPMPDAGDDIRRWRIDLAITASLPWGWHTGTATVRGTVKTPESIQPQRFAMGMNASAYGNLRAKDAMFRLLTLKPGSSINKTMKISSIDGAPFEITSTTVEGGGRSFLTAEAQPLNSNRTEWSVVLRGTGPTKPGIVKGYVITQTNVPGEEAIGLLYSGNVQASK